MKKLLAIIALASPALSMFGQGSSLDYFGAPATVIVTDTTNVINVQGLPVAKPIDIRMFNGFVRLDIYALTNQTHVGAVTVTPETSTDKTTWVSLPNYAIGLSNTIIYTNMFYGTNGLTATNTFILPGTITTPTSATAGFATPYMLFSPYTNTGALTPTNGWNVIGFNADDARRYVRLTWTIATGTTNLSVGAVLTGRAHVGNGL